jgi:predicted esterase
MDTHHLETPRTARYHTLGDPSRCCEVWFLLHGYGQRADDLLALCEPLLCDGRLLVAPEGLSRFYLRGVRGDVGASWMTRDDRELEIRDYLRWLDTLAAHLPPAGSERRSCVMGFSQGAATAWRWVLAGHTHVDRLVQWGGGIPPDADLAAHRPRLERMRIHLVRGESDAVWDEGAFADDCKRLADHAIAHDCHPYAGGHKVDGAVLRHLADA